MLKLKTKTEFLIPDGRGTKSVIVRMITSHFSMVDINNIKVEGYYYYIDENQNIIKLSDFGQNSSMKQWNDIEELENNSLVPPLDSDRNLKANILQRLKELTMLQLEQEGLENYGIPFDEWEEDNN